MSLVEMRGAAASYRRSGRAFQALTDIDLAIEAGEKVGIVGGSGSGKTTLARLMLGLLRPERGEIRFDGRSILGLRERDRGWLRASASMVFQDPHSSLNPRMKLRSIIGEPLRAPVLRRRRDVPALDTDVLAEAMRGVGLDEDLLDRYPHQLSGGQRQRTAFARALINDPALLVADEPVSALDVSVRAQVLNLLSREVSERNLALVLVSHDLAVVARLCDQVIVLERGTIVERGPVSTVLAQPEHPYTRALIDATLTL